MNGINYYCTGWIIPLPGWIITSHYRGEYWAQTPTVVGPWRRLGTIPILDSTFFWWLQVTTGVFLYESERKIVYTTNPDMSKLLIAWYYSIWFLTFPNWLYLVSWPIRWSYLGLFQVQLAGGNAEAADTRAEPLGPKKNLDLTIKTWR